MSTTKISDPSTTTPWVGNTMRTGPETRPTRKRRKKGRLGVSGHSNWSQRVLHNVLEVIPQCLGSRTSPPTVRSQAQGHPCRPMHLFHPTGQDKNSQKRSNPPNNLRSNSNNLNANNPPTTTARAVAAAVWSCRLGLVDCRSNHDFEILTPYRQCSTKLYDATNFFFELFTFSHCVIPYHTKPARHLVSDAPSIPFVEQFFISDLFHVNPNKRQQRPCHHDIYPIEESSCIHRRDGLIR